MQSLLENFEDKIDYYNRNTFFLNEARAQIETIGKAKKLVRNITTKEITDTNLEAVEEAAELITLIKNKEIKDSLMRDIEAVRLALSEDNRSLDEEAAIDEDKEIDQSELDEIKYVEESESDSTEVIEESRLEQIVVEENSANGPAKSNQDRSPNTEQRVETPSSVDNSSSINQPKPPASSQTSSSKSKSPSNTAQQESSTNRIVEKYQETKNEDIMYPTTRVESSSLTKGTEIVLKEGTLGNKIITYEVTVYTNGTSNRKIVSEEIVEPVGEIVTVGTKETVSTEEELADEE